MAAIPRLIRAPPASRRNSRIPPPGQPSAKVENSRCKVSRLKRKKFATGREDPKRGSGTPTFVLLQFDNSSLQPDRHRMRAVVRPQLREDIRHVSLDGVLGEIELRCDLLVGVARGDQPQDLNLALRSTSSSPVCSAKPEATSAGIRFCPACTARMVASSSLLTLPLSR